MISVIIVTILGYSLFQSSSIIVPERPDNFTVLFRYGVGSHNILNTTDGTFTKDMISDDPITIELILTESELDRIWELAHENKFYELDEHNPGPRNYSVVPHETYRLTVRAEDYPEKKVIMGDLGGNYTKNETRFLRIVKYIRNVIENRSEYKALPKPRDGYV